MQRPSSFPDVKLILDEAILSGGGTYVCTSHGAAVAFRHRCYKFRKSYFQVYNNDRYECLSFPRIPSDSCEVRIELSTPSGLFIPKRAVVGDSLTEAAAALRAKLGDLI